MEQETTNKAENGHTSPDKEASEAEVAQANMNGGGGDKMSDSGSDNNEEESQNADKVTEDPMASLEKKVLNDNEDTIGTERSMDMDTSTDANE